MLPKAWLVPSAALVGSPQETLAALQNPAFNPRLHGAGGILPRRSRWLKPQCAPCPGLPARCECQRYEGEQIDLEAMVAMNSMLVLGEKYYKGWRATVDGKAAEIYPVDHVLRGIYLPPGSHRSSSSSPPVQGRQIPDPDVCALFPSDDRQGSYEGKSRDTNEGRSSGIFRAAGTWNRQQLYRLFRGKASG